MEAYFILIGADCGPTGMIKQQGRNKGMDIGEKHLNLISRRDFCLIASQVASIAAVGGIMAQLPSPRDPARQSPRWDLMRWCNMEADQYCSRTAQRQQRSLRSRRFVPIRGA